MGGVVHRSVDPHTASAKWGKGYECWDASGATASGLWDLIPPIDCDITRIDIAFDFLVPDDIYPDHFVDIIESIKPIDRKSLHSAGGADRYTHRTIKIGSESSDRMIRIYRKDLEQLDKGRPGVRTTIRVELVLRSTYSKPLHAETRKDPEAIYRIAASHIHAMTGLVLGDLQQVPVERQKPSRELESNLWTFVRQNGNAINSFLEAGVSLESIARLSRQVHQGSSEFTQEAHRRRQTIYRQSDPMEAVRAVSDALRDAQGS